MGVSPARREFKNLLGQTNHFLITLLVGLDAVAEGNAKLSQTFSTTWNPHDPKVSAMRSRSFALKATLAWTVDAVDTYLHLARRSPRIMSQATCNRYDGKKPLESNVMIVAHDTNQDLSPAPYLLSAAIVWRNRLVHSLGDNKLQSDKQKILAQASNQISKEFQGLDVQKILSALDEKVSGTRSPSFKEVTSFVRAAHTFVRNADEEMLTKLDLRQYLLDVLYTYVTVDPDSRYSNVWGKIPARRLAAIRQIAFQYGMTESTDDTQLTLDSDVLEEIAQWTPREAKQQLSARA
ncbi:hypothetical protein [Acidithrix ferrooxidans]|nr:hypothetical protein [Acidithrix ferrooxidans]